MRNPEGIWRPSISPGTDRLNPLLAVSDKKVLYVFIMFTNVVRARWGAHKCQ